MKYKCQDLPQPVYYSRDSSGDEIEYYSANQMAQHEQRAVAPLLAEIQRLKRGEFICKKCGLRKDAECEKANF